MVLNYRGSMSFSRNFQFFCVFLVILLGNSVAAKTNYAKARYVLNEVYIFKKGSISDSSKVVTGQRVTEKDAIRTELESQLILATPDGSTLAIEENSLVSMSQILSEDGFNMTVIEINKGRLLFKAQKIANEKSKFEFKTGTAVAAIRGTEGIIGKTNKGKFFASLREGKLEIQYGNQTISINAGQTAVPTGETLNVYDLASSGASDFFNMVEAVLDDTTLTADSLAKILSIQDSILTQQKNSLADSIKCEFTPLPDKVNDTTVVAKGTCPQGILVEIGGLKKLSDGKEQSFKLEWDVTAPLGEKKFPITCHTGINSIPCGQLTTNYAGIISLIEATEDSTKAPEPLTLLTASPVNVCNPAALTIDGNFDSSDSTATLFVKFGKYTSPNLVPLSAGGEFTHTINISDKKDNWDETKAEVVFSSKTLGTHTVSLDVNIDKTCKTINTIPPRLNLKAADSLRCLVQMNLANANEDETIYRFSVDNGTESISTRYNKDAAIKQKLKTGIHDYTFSVEDQAGNKHSLTKTLGCYPSRRHTIEIKGSSYERFRVPINRPNLNGEAISNFFYKKLVFKVTNIPENDPRYIKSITISQNGKKDIVLRPTDFLSNTFDTDIELTRGSVTIVNIKVIMKNGDILKATKTYKAQ